MNRRRKLGNISRIVFLIVYLSASATSVYSNSCRAIPSKSANIVKCEPHQQKNNIYKCSCKFQQDNLTSSQTHVNNCLEVHPGMAVKGYNLIYHHWVSKEHCFNLCLKTNKASGDSFDCNSFEHWHSECTYESLFAKKTTTATLTTKTTTEAGATTVDSELASNTNATASTSKMKACTDYLNLLTKETSNVHFHEKRRVKKIDLCVLSNQTIESAASDFTFNHGVTYYEILCNRQTVTNKTNEWIPNKEEKPTKKTTKKVPASTRAANADKFQKCNFNPCSEHSTCVNDINGRFVCLCRKGYFGIYCQQKAIDKNCSQYAMDIYIAKQYVVNLNVKMSSIYVNDKQSADVDKNKIDEQEDADESHCKLSQFNQTHVKIHVPFDKCGTKTKKQGSKVIHSNDLYILMDDIRDVYSEYLVTVSCAFDELYSMYNKAIGSDDNDASTESATVKATTKKTTTTILKTHDRCVVNNIDIQNRVYSDRDFDSLIESNRAIDFSEKVFIEISVIYTDRSFKLFKQLDLRNAHLVISNFWLDFNDKKRVEYFIQNGCANDDIRFYEPVGIQKKAIRFSIKSELLNTITTKPISFNSQLEICVDNKQDEQQNVLKHNFTRLRYCENMNDMCSSMKTSKKKHPQHECQVKLTSGPFYQLINPIKSTPGPKKGAVSQGFNLKSFLFFHEIPIMASIFTLLFKFI